MAAIAHTASTQGGPQTRWGVCACGWTGPEHRGALARMTAAQDAETHVREKGLVADAQQAGRG